MKIDVKALEDLAAELKRRDGIIVAPNCIEIVTSNCVETTNGHCAINGFATGEIRKVFAILGPDEEKLALVARTEKKNAHDNTPVANRAFIDMLSDAMGCNIVYDEKCHLFVNENEVPSDTQYILLRFRDVFEDENIYPYRMDSDNDMVKSVQLFYQLFDTDDRKFSRIYSRTTISLNSFPKDVPDITVPVGVVRDGGKIRLEPLLYKPECSILRPLPILLGADFTGLTPDARIQVCCKGDRELHDFSRSWRCIKYAPSGLIIDGWGDLAECLKYTKFVESKKGT